MDIAPINKIIQGNALTELKKLPDEFVNCIITSPPYWGLRDYQIEGQIGLEKTLDEYIEKLLKITLELKRILRKDGVMFWNHGDCYGGNISAPNQPKLGKRDPYKNFSFRNRKRVPKCLCLQNYRLIIEMINQGWILRNTIIWHKPNHMPSSVKDRFANAYEPVFMLVKNKKYWFDLDAVRVLHKDIQDYLKHIPFNIRKRKGKPVAFMASPQEMKKRETKIPQDQAEGFGSPRARYHRKPLDERMEDTKSPKGSLAYNVKKTLSEVRLGIKPEIAGKNPGDVWKIPTQPFPSDWCPKCQININRENIESKDKKLIHSKCGTEIVGHFAIFPEKLIEPMILSSCPAQICKKCGKARVRITKTSYKVRAIRSEKEKHQNIDPKTARPNMPTMANAERETLGWINCNCNAGWKSGIVLDPFIGSGTVAIVAKRLKRNYIGIDLKSDYCKMAEQRIKATPTPLL